MIKKIDMTHRRCVFHMPFEFLSTLKWSSSQRISIMYDESHRVVDVWLVHTQHTHTHTNTHAHELTLILLQQNLHENNNPPADT